ncbi:hypothetical protein D0812_29150 (plasmid) [Vibrio owensii]|uniref:Uncharacterized protein n=6 Tax=Vibrio harveyi group TaxID=717610 RepID=A0AAX1G041_VIBPH|nr:MULTISPECIES: hypothetical protein [Vibrio harveyi group]AYO07877.1 hypothetical protein D0871_26645 [Vibrio parahaemolyticus]AYO18496.1 hypothetical protein D0812_29150 [Vibrio owensii]MBE3775503.1 hypothetical protein [Vibrio parahaemolyticus]MBE4075739.1 hypothetical protein [Vibrio parahaemolyticus]MBE4272579.1 hypothetical protein [Vibrio parahaemolyticus]
MTRLPNHVVTTLTSSSRWQLARQFQGKYQLTIERDGWRTRYYSDEPTVAISEAWRNKVEQDIAPDHWCLLDLHEKDVLFFMTVRDHVVRETRLVPLDELDEVKLKLCEQVFVSEKLTQSESAPNLSAVSDKVDTAPVLDPQDKQAYALKSQRPKTLAVAAIVLGVMLIGVSQFTHYQAKPKDTVQQVVDEYHAYRAAVGRAQSAADGMMHALSLTATSALAPSGWALSKISLKGNNLTAVFNREDSGLLSTAKTWLAKYSLSNAVLTIDTLSEPMTVKLDKWTTEMAPAQLGQRLADTLIKLGWDITDSKESKAMLTSTLDMTLKKSGVTLSELRSLATLYQPLPVGLNTFTLTPSDDGTYRVEMRIQYLGDLS